MTTETMAHLTTNELAQRWGLTAHHLANVRSEGSGVAYLKLGAAVRYRLADIEAYETAATVEAVE